MKHNGERQEGARRPDEILAEIDRTRHEMDYTLSAIEERLTPGQLVDQGIDYLRHSGANEFVHNLGGQVKYNPLPVSLVGIGLAWLMAAGKKQPDYGATSSFGSTGLGERTREMKDSMSETVQSMRDRASGATQSAKERISAIGSSARNQVDRAKGGVDYMMREQPLALGVIGLAVGAMFAALAPRTREEDELMGDTRDRLMDQAKELGREKLEQAKEAGKEKLEQAKKPETVPPKVGADLTPRGAGGTRGTS